MRPLFVFTLVFPLVSVAGAANLGLEETPYGFQQLLLFCWLHTKMGPSKVGVVITPPGPWSTSGPLSRACQQDLSRQPFLGILVM